MNGNSLAGTWKSLVRLLVRIGRAMPVLTAVWIGLPLLSGWLLLPGFDAQRRMIDAFVAESDRSWRDIFGAVWVPLGIYAGTALLRTGLDALQTVADSRMRHRATRHIQSEIYASALGVPLERMEQPDYYDRLSRAESVAGDDLLGVLQQAILLIKLAFECVGLLAVVSIGHWPAGVILAVAFAVSLAIRLESDMVKRRTKRSLTSIGRKAAYLQETAVRGETVRDMRISGSMRYLIASWSDQMHRSLRIQMDANRREIRRGMLVSSVQIAGLMATLAWMVLHLQTGEMSAGAVVVVFQAMRHAYGLSSRMAFPLGKLYIQSGKLADLIAFLQETHEEEDTAGATPLTVIPSGEIRMEGLGFQYPGADARILSDIHLRLRPGESVALVGENGAGKSTLVKLLLGLYRPTSGRLTWGGQDLQKLDQARLRQSMAAVFQDFVRYETTLRDNVAFGKAEETACDDEELLTALQKAGAARIASLAGGLDAPVGRLVEGGREFSGGEWQRLAIARAALRDSRLLVLDEPTSALDPQHETELYQAFRRLAEGRIVLFVSHRLGWARYADRVVVLREGRIAEEGSHAQLLAAGGQYAAMFRAQAEWYHGA